MGGRIVQLVQGERLAVESDDIDAWIDRFSGLPKVQLIDLDAAKGKGNNDALVARSARRCPAASAAASARSSAPRRCSTAARRTPSSARRSSRTAAIDLEFAQELADALGRDRLIAAVDSKGGHVVIDGWRTSLPLTAVEAVRQLEPFFGEFLYTHVDREGLMQGTDMAAIRAVRAATTPRVIAAGGITTMEEVDELDASASTRSSAWRSIPGACRCRNAELLRDGRAQPSRRRLRSR